MDQSTAPWRALEEDAASGGGASTTGAAADPARSGASRSTWIVAAFQQQHGRAWRDPFVDFYLGERMELALSEACGLPSFSPDVARADDATRAVYEEELTRLVELVAAGFRGAHADQRAWSSTTESRESTPQQTAAMSSATSPARMAARMMMASIGLSLVRLANRYFFSFWLLRNNSLLRVTCQAI